MSMQEKRMGRAHVMRWRRCEHGRRARWYHCGMRRTMGALVIVVLAGCEGTTGGAPGPDLGGLDAGDFAWSMVRWRALGSCSPTESGCHSSVRNFYPSDRSTLVNVPSQANPNKLRVKPGDPGASFLWQKLNNLQNSAAGEGTRMPPPNGRNLLD